ncbi:MAG: hypothetical protein HEP71_03495 [Roseivirga sp.]|nr:hypothetical protein [Roseivirga sp.]
MKGTRYLKYAIGEIVLVVIGILIALTINNWNEERRSKEQLKGYLVGIQKNLQSDTTNIRVINRRYKAANRNAVLFMNGLLQDEYSMQVLAGAIIAFGEKYVTIDQSGFESLKSSGYISKLQGTDLESSLFKYYNYYQSVQQIEISYNTFIENMEVRIFDRSSQETIDAMKFLNFGTSEATNTSVPMNEVVKSIYTDPHVIGAMGRAAQENTPHYDTLLSHGIQLLKLLQDEIQ